MSGMILTALEVEQFRRFSTRHRLDGLGPGLNVLAAPNESGKSTMLAALRGLFTVRHGSKAQMVKDFAPYDGGSPLVSAEFSLDGASLRMEKRFLGRSYARLLEGGRTLEGDDAENRLQALIEPDVSKRGEAGVMLGALWVAQGESFSQPTLSDANKLTLRDYLGADLGDAVGGADAARVLKRIAVDLGELLDGRGKPKGRFLAAIDGEAVAEARLVELNAKRATLAEDIATLEQTRRELVVASDAGRREAERAELAAAQAAKEELGRFDRRRAETALAAGEAERLTLGLREERKRRADRRARLMSLTRDSERAREATEAATLRRGRADAELARKRTALIEAEKVVALTTARVKVADRGVERLRVLGERAMALRQLARLEDALRRQEAARGALEAIRVDDAAQRRAETAERARAAAAAALMAQATGLEIALEAGALDRVTLNGAPMGSGRHDLLEPAELRIEGVGVFRILPAAREMTAGMEALRRAEAELSAALGAVDCRDMHQLHAEAERRRQAQATLASARATLDAVLSDGGGKGKANAEGTLSALRQRIAVCDAELERLHAQSANAVADASNIGREPDAPEIQAARLALDDAQQAHLRAEQAVAAARNDMLEPDGAQRLAESVLAETQTELRLILEQCERLRVEEEAAQAQEPDEALATRLDVAERALDQAERAAARVEQERPESNEAQLDARIHRLNVQIEGGRERLSQLQQECAAGEARVQAAEGLGLDEGIAATEREVSRCRGAKEACEREVAILTLLRRTLQEVEQETVERYLAPLTGAIQPSLDMLFPRSRVQVNTKFELTGVSRWREDEPLEFLSDGTREQIAVLVRLGLAELLRARGRPAALVLDDALVFSDAGRLSTMFDILAEASERMQIIVMTCRAEAFAALPGRRLRLQAVSGG
ncbi:AAA family ATPase [Acetobacter nitrogenifigens]|uniref:GTP-binding protein n=1 Tax=Acetobacter nitrogenifigens DSM 23921 = NBRC 105050 TaxID=1120919 RepID=A0A511XCS8_9PROT|nr:AAA family ATPase [Acetobacter nitrogenifigens]GEN60740.1 GTP-binding protein [Acetobacter nitrogenifigens DSM 23921 = NBRC 105050]